ncbi:hypothetical protein J6590_058591 [Homalodisca vitripennis]|nr:hypothetical protein J6590_058591 [Homalodisca vitripennis]
MSLRRSRVAPVRSPEVLDCQTGTRVKRFCLPVDAKGQRPRLRNPIVRENRPISSGDPLTGPR